jgi:inorganic phosphate transporter, PiT family
VTTGLLIVVGVITVALVFDFINGFHDAANSIATVVSTRVLSPIQAVAWAAFFNFAAAFTFGTAVAKTIGKGMIDLSVVTNGVILSGLVGAIVWDLLTWWWGLPTSSSHALIGGYAGAAIAKAGFAAIIPAGWTKTLMFIVTAPLMGLLLGWLLMNVLYVVVARWTPARVNRVFRRLQLVSAALYSLGHGSNDAQKTMGIIVGVLITGGYLTEFSIPLWVILSAHAAIALGTLSGGWRIVHTMGQRVTRLQPVGGFAAETSGAVTLFLASKLGIPVSTTHTITGAIVGVGATRRLSAVRWGVAGRIVWAWVLTIPCSAAIAAACFLVVRGLIP